MHKDKSLHHVTEKMLPHSPQSEKILILYNMFSCKGPNEINRKGIIQSRVVKMAFTEIAHLFTLYQAGLAWLSEHILLETTTGCANWINYNSKGSQRKTHLFSEKTQNMFIRTESTSVQQMLDSLSLGYGSNGHTVHLHENDWTLLVCQQLSSWGKPVIMKDESSSCYQSIDRINWHLFSSLIGCLIHLFQEWSLLKCFCLM